MRLGARKFTVLIEIPKTVVEVKDTALEGLITVLRGHVERDAIQSLAAHELDSVLDEPSASKSPMLGSFEQRRHLSTQ